MVGRLVGQLMGRQRKCAPHSRLYIPTSKVQYYVCTFYVIHYSYSKKTSGAQLPAQVNVVRIRRR